MNSHWSMPSQTIEGAGVTMLHNSGGRLGNVTVPPTNSSIQAEIFQAIDYENLNMVTRTSQNSTGPVVFYQVEVGTILNWRAGIMTQHLKQTSNYSVNQCKTIKLPRALQALPIPFIVGKLKDLSTGMYKCVGHHGGLDRFELSTTFPPKVITGTTPFLNMTIDTAVDASGLLKSMALLEEIKTKVSVTISGKTETMSQNTQMEQNIAYTKSQAGGPSNHDLEVPKEWGNCSAVHEPSLEDLLAEWEGSPHSPFLGNTRLISHMLRAVTSEMTFIIV
jgi:hypothetical protein